MIELRDPKPIIKPATRGLNSWLPIFTELRTTYYDAIMNLKPQLQDIAEVLKLPLQPYMSARAAAV